MSGGTAFPTAGGSDSGMTLRDYFAAKAMQGFISSPRILAATAERPITKPEDYAIAAYAVADAMLKARQS